MPEETHEINGIPLPRRSTRRKFVMVMLIFCALMVIYVTGWGNPDNSLHTSSLAWAWGSAVVTLFAYVFGAVVDNLNVLKLVKKDG